MSRNDQQVRETAPGDSRLRPDRAPALAEPFLERAAGWVLRGPLALGLVGLCGFQLATWLPHYLTWPWFADHDVFATLALGWERGQLPYRDLAGNNFPGTIYLFWIIGKLFGWGQTVPFYAVDATFVLVLGATLIVWSRRRFGHSLPGFVGFAAFLTYYLGLDFSRVAQRDWHGPFFILGGLLLAEAYPGRWGRRVSAAATAVAFAFRPQVVLFLPAVALAVAQGASEATTTTGSGSEGASPPGRKRVARALLEWGVLVAVLVVLAFVPLMVAGITRDFLRGIGLTLPGGQYNQTRAGAIAGQMVLQFLHLEFNLVPLGVLILAPLGDPALRATSRVWLLAYLGAWLYKPLSPVPFPYLEHALTLVCAINLALLVQCLMNPVLARPAIRLVAVLLAIGIGIQMKPFRCSVAYSRQAMSALRSGTEPVEAPLGLHIGLPVDPGTLAFPWEDYRQTLAYLRTQTRPESWVANLIHVVPALNGPAGRRTPLPAESLAWLAVRPEDESAFARAIEQAPRDSVVVWTPEMGQFVDLYIHYPQVRRLEPVIRRFYEPAARFGDIEVWRRKGQSG
jgi:hypothetical protein